MDPLSDRWRISSRSANNGACVEARYQGSEVHLRDSKNRTGQQLAFAPHEWTEFVAGIKAGEFDRPE